MFRAKHESMKSLFRATAILGSSSLVTITVGLVSSKVWALLLGPGGLGLMGLLQGLVGLSGLVAGLGIGVGVVRLGANALARDSLGEMAALRKAAWILFAATGGCSLLVLIAFRAVVSQYMLGTPAYAGSVVLVGLSLVFSLAAGMLLSLLNAYHRVSALAWVTIINSIGSAAISILLVWLWGERGIALALIGGAVVNWLAAWMYVRRELPPASVRPRQRDVLRAARALLRFGLPYTGSMIVGSGVQFLLPVLILHFLNKESVGFYRAAIAVSVGYIGFLLTAMGQDYYPRAAAISHQPAALVRLVNEQHRFIMLLGVPMIMTALALSSYLVPLVYSPQFSPAVPVLEWQLIGTLFKFSSWTMSYVILARCGSTTYFCTELVAGLVTVSATWLGLQWLGLMGVGVGFFITYVIYYLVVWILLRREIEFRWTRENTSLLLVSVLAALIIRSMPAVGLAVLHLPVALLFAALAMLGSSCVIWRELGGIRSIRARLSA